MLSINMRRGQVTLFVLLAVILIGVVVLFFSVDEGVLFQANIDIENPKAFIEECVSEATEESLDIMLPQAGFIDPGNYRLWEDRKAPYLCENTGSYSPCINQYPVLLTTIEQELESNATDKIRGCFDDLKEEFEERGNSVSFDSVDPEFQFAHNRVFIEIKTELVVEKNGVEEIFKDFGGEVVTPIYDLTLIAIEIISQEAKFCYFEYVGYMALHPEYDIRVDRFADSTKIYVIQDKKTEKDMAFSVRSCAIPPGI